ncbi:hypothetical protein X801_09164 [Opisthorchis viverrini]|uniref:Uncharacterized protein n=2 Tax=Opisthorchis viverrini TaxID=6198 RepID=A0A074ZPG5_OPIVI|nr:hypothetical protein T265_07307 [Opisthorchis viverrini]KER25205.1 hypothetical protein T265_07307 [Opisthorchis viverrini]OON15037.1 hypothetical protein X801_09164 [Opisthorchis viverrini]
MSNPSNYIGQVLIKLVLVVSVVSRTRCKWHRLSEEYFDISSVENNGNAESESDALGNGANYQLGIRPRTLREDELGTTHSGSINAAVHQPLSMSSEFQTLGRYRNFDGNQPVLHLRRINRPMYSQKSLTGSLLRTDHDLNGYCDIDRSCPELAQALRQRKTLGGSEIRSRSLTPVVCSSSIIAANSYEDPVSSAQLYRKPSDQRTKDSYVKHVKFSFSKLSPRGNVPYCSSSFKTSEDRVFTADKPHYARTTTAFEQMVKLRHHQYRDTLKKRFANGASDIHPPWRMQNQLPDKFRTYYKQASIRNSDGQQLTSNHRCPVGNEFFKPITSQTNIPEWSQEPLHPCETDQQRTLQQKFDRIQRKSERNISVRQGLCTVANVQHDQTEASTMFFPSRRSRSASPGKRLENNNRLETCSNPIVPRSLTQQELCAPVDRQSMKFRTSPLPTLSSAIFADEYVSCLHTERPLFANICLPSSSYMRATIQLPLLLQPELVYRRQAVQSDGCPEDFLKSHYSRKVEEPSTNFIHNRAYQLLQPPDEIQPWMRTSLMKAAITQTVETPLIPSSGQIRMNKKTANNEHISTANSDSRNSAEIGSPIIPESAVSNISAILRPERNDLLPDHLRPVCEKKLMQTNSEPLSPESVRTLSFHGDFAAHSRNSSIDESDLESIAESKKSQTPEGIIKHLLQLQPHATLFTPLFTQSFPALTQRANDPLLVAILYLLTQYMQQENNIMETEQRTVCSNAQTCSPGRKNIAKCPLSCSGRDPAAQGRTGEQSENENYSVSASHSELLRIRTQPSAVASSGTPSRQGHQKRPFQTGNEATELKNDETMSRIINYLTKAIIQAVHIFRPDTPIVFSNCTCEVLSKSGRSDKENMFPQVSLNDRSTARDELAAKSEKPVQSRVHDGSTLGKFDVSVVLPTQSPSISLNVALPEAQLSPRTVSCQPTDQPCEHLLYRKQYYKNYTTTSEPPKHLQGRSSQGVQTELSLFVTEDRISSEQASSSSTCTTSSTSPPLLETNIRKNLSLKISSQASESHRSDNVCFDTSEQFDCIEQSPTEFGESSTEAAEKGSEDDAHASEHQWLHLCMATGPIFESHVYIPDRNPETTPACSNQILPHSPNSDICLQQFSREILKCWRKVNDLPTLTSELTSFIDTLWGLFRVAGPQLSLEACLARLRKSYRVDLDAAINSMEPLAQAECSLFSLLTYGYYQELPTRHFQPPTVFALPMGQPGLTEQTLWDPWSEICALYAIFLLAHRLLKNNIRLPYGSVTGSPSQCGPQLNSLLSLNGRQSRLEMNREDTVRTGSLSSFGPSELTLRHDDYDVPGRKSLYQRTLNLLREVITQSTTFGQTLEEISSINNEVRTSVDTARIQQQMSAGEPTQPSTSDTTKRIFTEGQKRTREEMWKTDDEKDNKKNSRTDEVKDERKDDKEVLFAVDSEHTGDDPHQTDSVNQLSIGKVTPRTRSPRSTYKERRLTLTNSSKKGRPSKKVSLMVPRRHVSPSILSSRRSLLATTDSEPAHRTSIPVFTVKSVDSGAVHGLFLDPPEVEEWGGNLDSRYRSSTYRWGVVDTDDEAEEEQNCLDSKHKTETKNMGRTNHGVSEQQKITNSVQNEFNVFRTSSCPSLTSHTSEYCGFNRISLNEPSSFQELSFLNAISNDPAYSDSVQIQSLPLPQLNVNSNFPSINCTSHVEQPSRMHDQYSISEVHCSSFSVEPSHPGQEVFQLSPIFSTSVGKYPTPTRLNILGDSPTNCLENCQSPSAQNASSDETTTLYTAVPFRNGFPLLNGSVLDGKFDNTAAMFFSPRPSHPCKMSVTESKVCCNSFGQGVENDTHRGLLKNTLCCKDPQYEPPIISAVTVPSESLGSRLLGKESDRILWSCFPPVDAGSQRKISPKSTPDNAAKQAPQLRSSSLPLKKVSKHPARDKNNAPCFRTVSNLQRPCMALTAQKRKKNDRTKKTAHIVAPSLKTPRPGKRHQSLALRHTRDQTEACCRKFRNAIGKSRCTKSAQNSVCVDSLYHPPSMVVGRTQPELGTSLSKSRNNVISPPFDRVEVLEAPTCNSGAQIGKHPWSQTHVSSLCKLDLRSNLLSHSLRQNGPVKDEHYSVQNAKKKAGKTTPEFGRLGGQSPFRCKTRDLTSVDVVRPIKIEHRDLHHRHDNAAKMVKKTSSCRSPTPTNETANIDFQPKRFVESCTTGLPTVFDANFHQSNIFRVRIPSTTAHIFMTSNSNSTRKEHSLRRPLRSTYISQKLHKERPMDVLSRSVPNARVRRASAGTIYGHCSHNSPLDGSHERVRSHSNAGNRPRKFICVLMDVPSNIETKNSQNMANTTTFAVKSGSQLHQELSELLESELQDRQTETKLDELIICAQKLSGIKGLRWFQLVGAFDTNSEEPEHAMPARLIERLTKSQTWPAPYNTTVNTAGPLSIRRTRASRRRCRYQGPILAVGEENGTKNGPDKMRGFPKDGYVKVPVPKQNEDTGETQSTPFTSKPKSNERRFEVISSKTLSNFKSKPFTPADRSQKQTFLRGKTDIMKTETPGATKWSLKGHHTWNKLSTADSHVRKSFSSFFQKAVKVKGSTKPSPPAYKDSMIGDESALSFSPKAGTKEPNGNMEENGQDDLCGVPLVDWVGNSQTAFSMVKCNSVEYDSKSSQKGETVLTRQDAGTQGRCSNPNWLLPDYSLSSGSISCAFEKSRSLSISPHIQHACGSFEEREENGKNVRPKRNFTKSSVLNSGSHEESKLFGLVPERTSMDSHSESAVYERVIPSHGTPLPQVYDRNAYWDVRFDAESKEPNRAPNLESLSMKESFSFSYQIPTTATADRPSDPPDTSSKKLENLYHVATVDTLTHKFSDLLENLDKSTYHLMSIPHETIVDVVAAGMSTLIESSLGYSLDSEIIAILQNKREELEQVKSPPEYLHKMETNPEYLDVCSMKTGTITRNDTILGACNCLAVGSLDTLPPLDLHKRTKSSQTITLDTKGCSTQSNLELQDELTHLKSGAKIPVPRPRTSTGYLTSTGSERPFSRRKTVPKTSSSETHSISKRSVAQTKFPPKAKIGLRHTEEDSRLDGKRISSRPAVKSAIKASAQNSETEQTFSEPSSNRASSSSEVPGVPPKSPRRRWPSSRPAKSETSGTQSDEEHSNKLLGQNEQKEELANDGSPLLTRAVIYTYSTQAYAEIPSSLTENIHFRTRLDEMLETPTTTQMKNGPETIENLFGEYLLSSVEQVHRSPSFGVLDTIPSTENVWNESLINVSDRSLNTPTRKASEMSHLDRDDSKKLHTEVKPRNGVLPLCTPVGVLPVSSLSQLSVFQLQLTCQPNVTYHCQQSLNSKGPIASGFEAKETESRNVGGSKQAEQFQPFPVPPTPATEKSDNVNIRVGSSPNSSIRRCCAQTTVDPDYQNGRLNVSGVADAPTENIPTIKITALLDHIPLGTIQLGLNWTITPISPSNPSLPHHLGQTEGETGYPRMEKPVGEDTLRKSDYIQYTSQKTVTRSTERSLSISKYATDASDKEEVVTTDKIEAGVRSEERGKRIRLESMNVSPSCCSSSSGRSGNDFGRLSPFESTSSSKPPPVNKRRAISQDSIPPLIGYQTEASEFEAPRAAITAQSIPSPTTDRYAQSATTGLEYSNTTSEKSQPSEKFVITRNASSRQGLLISGYSASELPMDLPVDTMSRMHGHVIKPHPEEWFKCRPIHDTQNRGSSAVAERTAAREGRKSSPDVNPAFSNYMCDHSVRLGGMDVFQHPYSHGNKPQSLITSGSDQVLKPAAVLLPGAVEAGCNLTMGLKDESATQKCLHTREVEAYQLDAPNHQTFQEHSAEKFTPKESTDVNLNPLKRLQDIADMGENGVNISLELRHSESTHRQSTDVQNHAVQRKDLLDLSPRKGDKKLSESFEQAPSMDSCFRSVSGMSLMHTSSGITENVLSEYVKTAGVKIPKTIHSANIVPTSKTKIRLYVNRILQDVRRFRLSAAKRLTQGWPLSTWFCTAGTDVMSQICSPEGGFDYYSYRPAAEAPSRSSRTVLLKPKVSPHSAGYSPPYRSPISGLETDRSQTSQSKLSECVDTESTFSDSFSHIGEACAPLTY